MGRLGSARLVAPLLALLGACGEARAGAPELRVAAAASTRDALLALEQLYEEATGVELVLQLGSSGTLARQIVAAASADVFLSADEREMDRVDAAGLLADGSRRALLSNQLVVIVPADAPALDGPFDAHRLAGAHLRRLALADPAGVPAGRYARAWLEGQGLWAAVEARVLPAVDVRAALAAVEAGAAEAGIVYRTDAARSGRVRIVHVVPAAEGPAITYPAAALAGPREARARAFVDFLGSPAARAVFEAQGFRVLPAPAER